MCVGLRCAHPTCPLTGALGRAELDKVRGQAFVPVNGPAVAAPSTPDMPSLLPEQALAALPEAPPMPFDPTGRFAQGVPFGLEEYLELVDTMGCVVSTPKSAAPSPATCRRCCSVWGWGWGWTLRLSSPARTRSSKSSPMPWAHRPAR